MTTSESSLEIRSTSEEQTRSIGALLGSALKDGALVLLHGHFGAGKTVLVQGIALGLEIDDPVTSPSFVLMVEHVAKRKLVHVDFFRIERPDADLLASIEDYLDGDWVVVIEWPDWIPASLAGDAIHVSIDSVNESERQIRIDANGSIIAAVRSMVPGEARGAAGS